ncbi:CUB and sushi domain-containing protein 1-like isoform X2 [Acropora muricata]|uniref:CUB and sushi domain-containing protein 1-like isoform X2 n=1 Tax=Acropora muricata TaxID=159855 RepID=UPI0034E51A10
MLLYAIILNVLLLQGVKAKEESALGICERPIVPSRGPLILHGNSFLDGDEVQFSCVANYDLFGSQRSRCVGQRWNTRIPECKARCIFGGNPGNGFAVRNALFKRMVKHGLQIVYRCNEHYALIGSATQECNNGQWTNARPSCKGICERPIVPSRGPLILHGNRFLDGDEVQFSCVANYDLFGSQRSRCVGQKWNNRKPECKARCIFGGDPDNGFVVRNAFFNRTVKHGLQIVYRCNKHYALIGSATQKCNNGQWTNARPSCKGTCGRPIIPSRGPLILLGNSFLDGDEVQFSCVADYDLFGSQRSRCVGQKWNNRKPECKARCIFGGDPDNGFAVRNAFFNRTVKHGVQIVYRCNEHYTLIGSATQECSNGQWTNTRPSCKGTCGRPIIPSRGPLILLGNSFLDGDEVQFSCVANYDLFGSQRSRCNGQKWNTSTPECKARCIFGGDPNNGFAVRNAFFKRMVKHGLQIVYRCFIHYTLIGSATRECNNGQWATARPSCKGTCGRPIVPLGGPLILHGNSFLDGDEVKFSCVANYDLFGSQRIRCFGRKWNTGIPECKARCIFGGDPDNGFAVRNAFFNRVVKHGLQIVYHCNKHHTLIGSATQECNNGQWTNTRPSCKASCRRPEPPMNGGMRGDNFNHNKKVVFYCDENYQLVGQSQITCKDGSWSDLFPKCSVVNCGPLQRPDHGDIIEIVGTTFGNRIVFECTGKGYEIRGSKVRTCQSDGSWSGLPTTCELVKCDDPGTPVNGMRIVSKGLVYGGSLRFKCNRDYTLMKGMSEIISCQANKRWTASVPQCLAPCRDPGVPRQGNRIGDDFRHDSKVTFSCPNGYLMEGVGEISCSNGTWSNRVPTCKAPCVQFSRPAYGYMRGDFRHGNEVRFVCYYGYQMIGAASSTCNDGTWSDSAPICKGICGRPRVSSRGPLNLHGNSFLDGDEVQFSCIANYDLFGSQKSRCVGRRWNTRIPECKVNIATCSNPGEPAHGRRLSNDFQDGRTVAFKCDGGFDLFGNKAILCSGGSWNASIPECKACQNPIGMENPSIRNIRITSADYLSSPNFARLNGRFAWCTTKQTYLQVNIGKRQQLTAITTQGGQDNTGIISWVRKYKLSFFAGPRKEIFYQESGTQHVIDGNQNASSTITYFFKEPFITQVVRIYPNFHSTPVCLRMELYGCDPNPDCIHVGSVVWGLWEREGDSLSYYLVYITQLNATHVDFVLHLSHPDSKLLTRSYNRSEPVLVVDKTPKMTDISVGSRVIAVHRRTHKEWYKNGIVIRTSSSIYVLVRFNSGTMRWVPMEELRLEKRPRFCTTGA